MRQFNAFCSYSLWDFEHLHIYLTMFPPPLWRSCFQSGLTVLSLLLTTHQSVCPSHTHTFPIIMSKTLRYFNSFALGSDILCPFHKEIVQYHSNEDPSPQSLMFIQTERDSLITPQQCVMSDDKPERCN